MILNIDNMFKQIAKFSFLILIHKHNQTCTIRIPTCIQLNAINVNKNIQITSQIIIYFNHDPTYSIRYKQ